MKLPEILILAVGAGFLIIWIAEYQRTDFAGSYWLLMLFLGCILAFQYVKNKRLEREKTASSATTKRVENRKKKK